MNKRRRFKAKRVRRLKRLKAIIAEVWWHRNVRFGTSWYAWKARLRDAEILMRIPQ